jgi:hypothetical protein
VKNEKRHYIEKLLNLYVGLPQTPQRTSRYDRQLAYQLYEKKVPLEIVEAAFVLASTRRIYRDAGQPRLGPIRSLHYFLPVIEEVTASQLPLNYVQYLRNKLESHAARKPISK